MLNNCAKINVIVLVYILLSIGHFASNGLIHDNE